MRLLSDAQRAFLEERHYGVFATINADGSIQQTVVWYLLDGATIRISVGAQSVKAANVRRNANASLAIEDTRRYLTLSGTAVVEPFDPHLREQLALRYVGPERAAAWLQQRPDAARLALRMTIGRVYGQAV
jgi:PPOX class probable F420-dependent enzyme